MLERLTIVGLEVYNTLLRVQTTELLSGGDVGDVVFNGTVPLSCTTATTATSESGEFISYKSRPDLCLLTLLLLLLY